MTSLRGLRKIKEFKIEIRDKNTGYGKKINVKQFDRNGLVESFYTDADPSSVQVFPITDDLEIYTVKQWRPGIEKEQYELPGGGLADGEDPMDAARRELKEETGLDAGKMIHLASVPYSPYSSGIRHMYLAVGCKKTSGPDLDPNEFLEVVVWNLDDFRKLMKSGGVRGFDGAYMALDKLGFLTL